MIIICLVAAGAASLRAADYYAAKNGQASTSPYDTWLKAASTNDTVWVGAGRYTVPPNFTNYIGTNVVFISRPMTLRSSNGVPATTIIDGGGSLA